jgi:Tfp pilus assembly major pilin PilA
VFGLIFMGPGILAAIALPAYQGLHDPRVANAYMQGIALKTSRNLCA